MPQSSFAITVISFWGIKSMTCGSKWQEHNRNTWLLRHAKHIQTCKQGNLPNFRPVNQSVSQANGIAICSTQGYTRFWPLPARCTVRNLYRTAHPRSQRWVVPWGKSLYVHCTVAPHPLQCILYAPPSWGQFGSFSYPRPLHSYWSFLKSAIFVYVWCAQGKLCISVPHRHDQTALWSLLSAGLAPITFRFCVWCVLGEIKAWMSIFLSLWEPACHIITAAGTDRGSIGANSAECAQGKLCFYRETPLNMF